MKVQQVQRLTPFDPTAVKGPGNRVLPVIGSAARLAPIEFTRLSPDAACAGTVCRFNNVVRLHITYGKIFTLVGAIFAWAADQLRQRSVSGESA